MRLVSEEFGAGGAGERVVQLGFDWMPPGKMSLSELPARVQRLAYREFTKNPDLEMAEFNKIAGLEFFGSVPRVKGDAEAKTSGEIDALTDDLLFLQNCVNFQRVWTWPSPMVDPKHYERKARDVKWREANQEEYARRLGRLRQIAKLSEGSKDPANTNLLAMKRIAEFILQKWDGPR